MKKLFSVLLMASGLAYAGERFIGQLAHLGTKNNSSSNPDGAVAVWDGGNQMPFPIVESSKLTIICPEDTYVCTDVASCTPLTGVLVPGGVLFPTSVGGPSGTLVTNAGNTIRTAIVSVVISNPDAGFHACGVFERTGKE